MSQYVYSVCGYHPTDGELAYANYRGFTSRFEAQLWAAAAKRDAIAPLWSLSEVAQHAATPGEVERLRRCVNTVAVSDEMLGEVENLVGMGHGAWDCIDPKEIIASAVKAWNKFAK